MKNIFPLLIFGLTIPAFSQTWVKVAVDGNTISIPAGTSLRYGALAGTPYGCGTGAALATASWVTPKTASTVVSASAFGVTDPAYCYSKELDVLATTSAQTVTVNGKPVTVAALPVVTPPPPATVTYVFPCSITGPATGPWPATTPITCGPGVKQ